MLRLIISLRRRRTGKVVTPVRGKNAGKVMAPERGRRTGKVMSPEGIPCQGAQGRPTDTPPKTPGAPKSQDQSSVTTPLPKDTHRTWETKRIHLPGNAFPDPPKLYACYAWSTLVFSRRSRITRNAYFWATSGSIERKKNHTCEHTHRCACGEAVSSAPNCAPPSSNGVCIACEAAASQV